MARPLFVECMECGLRQPFFPTAQQQCEKCGAIWLEPHYDYTLFKREVLKGLSGRPYNTWRYLEVLPLEHPQILEHNNVGWTPLQRSLRFAENLGHRRTYIKDERFGPTGSFKDRQATVSVAAMLEAGVRECVIASTGNAGVAYAAACARAGIKLWVFMTSLVPQEKLREVALFGAEVIKITGTYDQTKQIASEFAKRRGLLYDRGAHSIPARESMKVIAYEIVEQLGWRAPDWYIQAVSGGLGPLGVYHGFKELYDMGLIDRIPKVAVIQAEGCAPMVKAFKAGQPVATPVNPETRIAILSTGDPGKPYTYLYRLLQQYGGTMESVSDMEAFAVMHELARTEGTAVEPAAAVAFAGYSKMLKNNQIGLDDLVVINCTGHTFPVEKHVLGDQPWRVDLTLSDHEKPLAPREGLVSALEALDEKTTCILIVDDNPDDALLISRFLEARKSYRVFHADNGYKGLAEARQRLPDLIILDMMMPGMDGLSLLKELKQDSKTMHIPVMVVTAKDITEAEIRRVTGSQQVEAVYQKGVLPVQAFVSQLVAVLEKGHSEEIVE